MHLRAVAMSTVRARAGTSPAAFSPAGSKTPGLMVCTARSSTPPHAGRDRLAMDRARDVLAARAAGVCGESTSMTTTSTTAAGRWRSSGPSPTERARPRMRSFCRRRMPERTSRSSSCRRRARRPHPSRCWCPPLPTPSTGITPARSGRGMRSGRRTGRPQAAAWGAYPHNAGDHAEFGLSTYNDHTDGSGISIASWHRPMLNVRIGYISYPYPEIRGSGLRHFPADTHLTAWLEAKGYDYDIVTDQELHDEGAELLDRYRMVHDGDPPGVPHARNPGRSGSLSGREAAACAISAATGSTGKSPSLRRSAASSRFAAAKGESGMGCGAGRVLQPVRRRSTAGCGVATAGLRRT